jgi:hypothetical protein
MTPTRWGSLCYLATALAIEQTLALRATTLSLVITVITGKPPATALSRALVARMRSWLAETPPLGPDMDVRTWAADAGIPWDWSPPWRTRTPPGEMVLIFARERMRLL